MPSICRMPARSVSEVGVSSFKTMTRPAAFAFAPDVHPGDVDTTVTKQGPPLCR